MNCMSVIASKIGSSLYHVLFFLLHLLQHHIHLGRFGLHLPLQTLHLLKLVILIHFLLQLHMFLQYLIWLLRITTDTSQPSRLGLLFLSHPLSFRSIIVASLFDSFMVPLLFPTFFNIRCFSSIHMSHRMRSTKWRVGCFSWTLLFDMESVSYTHLTLPTIYSV